MTIIRYAFANYIILSFTRIVQFMYLNTLSDQLRPPFNQVRSNEKNSSICNLNKIRIVTTNVMKRSSLPTVAAVIFITQGLTSF